MSHSRSPFTSRYVINDIFYWIFEFYVKLQEFPYNKHGIYSLLSNKRGSTFILFEEFVTPPHLQSPLHVYFSLEIVPASTFIATLHIY